MKTTYIWTENKVTEENLTLTCEISEIIQTNPDGEIAAYYQLTSAIDNYDQEWYGDLPNPVLQDIELQACFSTTIDMPLEEDEYWEDDSQLEFDFGVFDGE